MSQELRFKNSNKKTFYTHLVQILIFCATGLYPFFSTAQNVHPAPSCSGSGTTYSLSWGGSGSQVLWSPAGSLTNTFVNVASSGHDFTFTYSGDTDDFDSYGSGLTPNIQTAFSDGTTNVLSHYVNPPFGSSSTITLTIDIFPSIEAKVAFDLYHVNKDANKGDKLSVYADYNGGTPLYPDINDNGNPSWQESGSGVVNGNASSTSGNDDQVGISFSSSQRINRITIIWEDCATCYDGERGFGLGAIEFCSFGPDYDRDGISDINDVDDDNDGIPDNYELCLNAPAPAIPNETTVSVYIQFDSYPQDVSWQLHNSSGSIVKSGGSYSPALAGSSVEEYYTGTVDDYTFTISDDFQNGICCTYGPGYYEIKVQDFSVLGGSGNGNFGDSATENFNSGEYPVSPFYCLASDPSADDDSDGVPNYKDADFCTLNSAGVCTSLDTDGDGIINSFDRDSDNDGIPDLIEARGTDSNGDGIVDNLTDIDADGLADVYDNDVTDGPSGASACNDFPACLFDESTSSLIDTDGDGTNDNVVDADNDGYPNFQDVDADNDGFTDVNEAGGTDADADAQQDGSDVGDYGYNATVDPNLGGAPLILAAADGGDTDSRPEYSAGAYSGSIADSDADDVPDFLDVDSDNDGIFDNYELQPTASYTAPASGDTDGDGLLNVYDDSGSFGGKGLDADGGTAGAQAYDFDGDGLPDYIDTDADDDNICDRQEAWDNLYDGDSSEDNVSSCSNIDTDGDGLIDCFDSNSGDASVFSWAASPADDNGTTDGQTGSSGTLFASGSSLDALLPDNGGNSNSEPDFRDQLIQCGSSQVYYAMTEKSPGTATDFEYNDGTDFHVDGASTNSIRATSYCEPDADGWYYFFNPLEPENFLFSIRNSSGSPNTVEMSELVDYIEMKTESNPYNRYVMGASSATLVMKRDWNVVFKGSPDNGSTFDIKFYFKPEELQALNTVADSLVSAHPGAARYALQWFKKPGGLSNSDITAAGVTNETDITDLATEVFNEITGVAEDGAARSTDGDGSSSGNARNYIEFQGLSSFSGGTAMIKIAYSPLPVELETFDASAQGCQTTLYWTTASEENFNHFMLERSEDGRNFQAIGTIRSAGGNFFQAYQYQDNVVAPLNYYRLKMIDYDGSFEYSRIIAVESGCDLETGHLQVFPNPISHQQKHLQIRLHTRQEGARLRLISVAGQLMKEAVLPVQPGWNLLSLDVSDLPPGIYFLTNAAENRYKTERVIITDIY